MMQKKTMLILLLLIYLQPALSAQENEGSVDISLQTVQDSDLTALDVFHYNYILSDNANLRKEPSLTGEILKTLPIGSKIKLIESAPKPEKVGGNRSYWYKVASQNQTGWMWGAAIASFAFGSQSDREVKFLLGLENADSLTYQLRAFKDNVQIDKLIIKSFSTNLGIRQVKSLGNAGLTGVSDVIILDLLEGEYCGAVSGSVVVFWDGHKFTKVTDLFAMPDSWASGWTNMIFPIDMEGLENTVIKTTEEFVDDLPNGKGRRSATREYFRWNGTDLVPDPSRKTEVKFYIIDTDINN